MLCHIVDFRANISYHISTKVGDIMNSITDYIDDSGILVTADVVKAGIPKTQLYSFIQQNSFERVAHGVYVSPEAWADDNYVLSLRCPNAVFSHDEALYYHGLIDREPSGPTITIYTGYSTSRLIKDGIKVYTVKRDLLEVGKTTVVNSFGHKIPIYDMERTICDLVRNRTQFEIQDYQTALKAYASRRDKDLNRLMKYAELFHITSKLREYMEVIL